MLKIAFDPLYIHPLPEGHRFPMLKYSLIPEQLLYEGVVEKSSFFKPVLDVEKYIRLTHCHEYLQRLENLELSRSEVRRIGFELVRQLVDREKLIMSGTVQNAIYALEFGCSMNVAGGTHHAYTNRGEGFCMLNDIAVGANYLLEEKKAKKVLVVDLDVHQGNGTAEIFANDSRVFTFSMHGANNYPLRKETSDLDIALNDSTKDSAYLSVLDNTLGVLINKQKPDFVFFQSGVDVLDTDKLGRLGLSVDGCKKRDELVLNTCYEFGLPIAISMGGGYSQNIGTIVDAHVNTFKIAQETYF